MPTPDNLRDRLVNALRPAFGADTDGAAWLVDYRLLPIVTDLLADAWDAGRASIAHDLTQPLGDDGQRPATPNPHRSA